MGIVVANIAIGHSAEVFECHPIPRPVIEKLVFEASEEALARRIVRRACPLRHRSGDMAPKLAHKGSNLCRAPVAQSVPQGEGVERGWAA